MFIPIVRRTITVRIRDTFRFPFYCDACYLSVGASVFAEGIGRATMAYLAPDENVARHAARQNAYGSAQRSFSQCPCPRCGAHSTMSRNAVRAYEQRFASRKQLRFWLTIVGLGLSFLLASGCAVSGAMASEAGDGGIGAAIILWMMGMAIGAAITGIAYAVAGPGARPVLLPYIPQNVVFDPPPAY